MYQKIPKCAHTFLISIHMQFARKKCFLHSILYFYSFGDEKMGLIISDGPGYKKSCFGFLLFCWFFKGKQLEADWKMIHFHFKPPVLFKRMKTKKSFSLCFEGHHHYSSWHPGKKGDKGGRFWGFFFCTMYWLYVLEEEMWHLFYYNRFYHSFRKYHFKICQFQRSFFHHGGGVWKTLHFIRISSNKILLSTFRKFSKYLGMHLTKHKMTRIF